MTSGSLGVRTALRCKAFLKIPKPADRRRDRLRWCTILQCLGKLYVLLLGITISSEMFLRAVGEATTACPDEQTVFVWDKLLEDDGASTVWP